MNRVLLTTVGLLALAFLRAGAGGCDSSIVGDPTMDMWCGKTLCAWTVDKGEIQRVATWHRSDYGVGLVGDEVILSQRSSATIYASNCLEFRLQADRDDGVNLFMELDLTGDDDVEFSRPLSGDKFAPEIFYLRLPMTVYGARFVVRKAGKGAATLAEVKVKQTGSVHCVGMKPLTLSDLEDGSDCNAASQCRGGSCTKVTQGGVWGSLGVEVCSSCTTGTSCPSGKVCSLAWSEPSSYLHQACVGKGSRELGERCQGEQECKSGICCGGVCSSCCSSGGHACAVGSCGVMSFPLAEMKHAPRPSLCSPGGGVIAAGGPCLQGSDCASGSCKGSGALKVCALDGRTCAQDEDCPNNQCREVGQAGGVCQ